MRTYKTASLFYCLSRVTVLVTPQDVFDPLFRRHPPLLVVYSYESSGAKQYVWLRFCSQW